MKYFQPKSLTWWSGVFAIAVGVASMAVPQNSQLSELSTFVALLAGSGDSSPATLLAVGFGLIGLRARFEAIMRTIKDD
jgi:hypothetical protein